MSSSNNTVTSIALDSLETKLGCASVQKSWTISESINIPVLNRWNRCVTRFWQTYH